MACYSLSKSMFGSLTVMAFVWLLMVNTSHQRSEPVSAAVEKAATMTIAAEFSGISREKVVIRSGGKVVHQEWHLNYMSKRRVPNGPDPIHNRRAGNSGRPPGKA